MPSDIDEVGCGNATERIGEQHYSQYLIYRRKHLPDLEGKRNPIYSSDEYLLHYKVNEDSDSDFVFRHNHKLDSLCKFDSIEEGLEFLNKNYQMILKANTVV